MQYVYQLAENVDAGELHLEDLFDLIEYPEVEMIYASIANVEDEAKYEALLNFVIKYEELVSPQLVSRLLTSSHLSNEMRAYLFRLFNSNAN